MVKKRKHDQRIHPKGRGHGAHPQTGHSAPPVHRGSWPSVVLSRSSLSLSLSVSVSLFIDRVSLQSTVAPLESLQMSHNVGSKTAWTVRARARHERPSQDRTCLVTLGRRMVQGTSSAPQLFDVVFCTEWWFPPMGNWRQTWRDVRAQLEILPRLSTTRHLVQRPVLLLILPPRLCRGSLVTTVHGRLRRKVTSRGRPYAWKRSHHGGHHSDGKSDWERWENTFALNKKHVRHTMRRAILFRSTPTSWNTTCRSCLESTEDTWGGDVLCIPRSCVPANGRTPDDEDWTPDLQTIRIYELNLQLSTNVWNCEQVQLQFFVSPHVWFAFFPPFFRSSLLSVFPLFFSLSFLRPLFSFFLLSHSHSLHPFTFLTILTVSTFFVCFTLFHCLLQDLQSWLSSHSSQWQWQ